MWKFRLACYVYILLLTLLLLAPDPSYFARFSHLPRIGGSLGVHFAAFAGLGFLVFAARFPHRGAITVGLLLAYAAGVELAQYFVPLRTVEAADLIGNFLGLAAGAAVWRTVGDHHIFEGGDHMLGKRRFRLHTPEGLVTRDTFVLADEQPDWIKADCLLLIHESSGRTITAHGTRLVPAEDPLRDNHDHEAKSVCASCGHVEGVVEDEVTCPHLEDDGCGLVKINS